MSILFVQRNLRKDRATVAIACVLLSACSAGGSVSPVVEVDNIASWSRVGEADWEFADDGVSAGPEDTVAYLVSTRRYDDFRLSVEFWIEDDTNSGVFVRCSDPAQIDPDTCYEVNIWDKHPNQRWRTGSIVTLAEPLAQVDSVGRWNRLQIEAIGDSIVAEFNGVTTAMLRSDRSLDGYIALQYGGGRKLRFRNLTIELR